MEASREYLGHMIPVVLVALLALLCTGCKRHDTAAVSKGVTAGSSALPGPPVQTPTETIEIPASDDVNAVLDQLSTELRAYISKTRSVPKDFQDFVTRDHVQTPPPPAGKKYAITKGKVVLVNQ